MKLVLSFLLIGILLAGSFISQVGIASADSNKDKQNQHKQNNKNVLEFGSAAVLFTSSTTTICHIPPGNPDNSHVIVVGTSSLTAHLKHGDIKGNCGN